MQAQCFVILACWSLGGLLRARRRQSEQEEFLQAARLDLGPSRDVQHESHGKGGTQRSFWHFLIIAVVADAPLCYVTYTHAANHQGQKDLKTWATILCAALPAILSVVYLFKSFQRWRHQRGKAIPGALGANRADAQDLTGTWVKDSRASDSMAGAIELAHLNRLTRTAVRLIKGVQILQTKESFDFTVFSVIAWFKVKETYPMDGQPRQEKRRDLRNGKHTGWIGFSGAGHIRLHLQWGYPFGGAGYDEFQLITRDVLHVVSHIEIDDKTADYTTVYKRKL